MHLLCCALVLGGCDGDSDGDKAAAPETRLQVSELEFADEHLQRCIVGIADDRGWVYADEIEEIECVDENITSLEGMETFGEIPDPGLRYLALNSSITDFSPLSGLDSLVVLRSVGAPVADIEPLSGLSGLEELELAGVLEFSGIGCAATSYIESFSPLAELSGLRVLTLYGCFVANDYTAIESLTQLEELHLVRNDHIDELPSLAGLSGLRVLDLSLSYRIRNIDTLASLTELTHLVLNGSAVAGGLEPISDLVKLRELLIEDSGLEDVSLLAGLVNLESLSLIWRELDLNPRGRIADLTPLANLDKLSVLRLEHQKIVDISPLTALSGLTELSLADNAITDLTPLAPLDKLSMLNIDKNQFLELDALVDLENLEKLSLYDNIFPCSELDDFIAARPNVEIQGDDRCR